MTPASVITLLQLVAVWAAAAAGAENVEMRGTKGAHSGICVVIRSYWAHGGAGNDRNAQPLRKLLTTLQQQSNPK